MKTVTFYLRVLQLQLWPAHTAGPRCISPMYRIPSSATTASFIMVDPDKDQVESDPGTQGQDPEDEGQELGEEELEVEEEVEVEEEEEEEEQEGQQAEELATSNPTASSEPSPSHPASNQQSKQLTSSGPSAGAVANAPLSAAPGGGQQDTGPIRPDPVGDESFAALRALEAQVVDKLSGFKLAALANLGSMQAVAPKVTEATHSLSDMATKWTAGVSSWLSGSEPSASKAKEALQLHTSKASNELQSQFNLDETEHLVESFKCKLLQVYACAHNTYTPSIQMAFQGTLHVTDKHVCFGVEEKGKQLAIKVPFSTVQEASRQLPAQRGSGPDVLRLNLENGKYIAFKDFEAGGGALDSALALIEHLMSPDG